MIYVYISDDETGYHSMETVETLGEAHAVAAHLSSDFDIQIVPDTDPIYTRYTDLPVIEVTEIHDCRYCGLPTDVDPSDQEAPIDYCHH